MRRLGIFLETTLCKKHRHTTHILLNDKSNLALNRSGIRYFCNIVWVFVCLLSSEIAARVHARNFVKARKNYTFWATFFPWRWGGCSAQAWMPTYFSIVHIPQIIWVWRATVEWYIDRRKSKNSEKNLSQCCSGHQTSHMEWPGPPRWEADD
jgi:hypothetical protein